MSGWVRHDIGCRSSTNAYSTDYERPTATAWHSAAPPCGLTLPPKTDWPAFCGAVVTWPGVLLRGPYVAEAY